MVFVGTLRYWHELAARDYLQAQPEPVNYVSEVRGETPPYKCLSCGTIQAPCCSDCVGVTGLKRSSHEYLLHNPETSSSCVTGL